MNFFWENDGYAVSYYYVEYLIQEFGREAVLRLIESSDYHAALGESEKDVYTNWLAYMDAKSSMDL